jgi:hypothetical protein
VIAEPNSSTTPEQPAAEATAEKVQKSFLEDSPLTADELYQLTLYKWRYSLEAYGFDRDQVRELMFLKWLHASHRVQG